jgi:NhaA family Na+:H+ antiporter
MIVRKIKDFFEMEASGGILLALAAIAALIVNNSPLQNYYESFLSAKVMLQISDFQINKTALLWINDGLMAIFFFLIGLEIKREVLEGKLSSKEQLMLPAFAALGGLAVPALFYVYFNFGDSVAISGWAIPAATDIAFALGVITLLGDRVPKSLKITLVAIAIIDDLAAILIIAFFYTEKLSLFALFIGLISVCVLFALNRARVSSKAAYILVGVFFWACVLKSGVHATLAGVILAFFIPLNLKDKYGHSPLVKLEHDLHPWVAYLILPVFAFANAGVSFKGMSLEYLMHPITLGIAFGLFFGKQIGVMLITYLTVLMKICKLPEGVNWKQYYGMSVLTGIGFTMSLFIGGLAFSDPSLQVYVRIGVLLGSIASGLFGFYALKKFSS